jgi:transposase
MARPRKHRHWSDQEKRSICSQALAAGVSVAQVARRYAMNANLIFKWLNDPRFLPDGVVADEQTFLPIEIRSEALVDSTPLIDVPVAACSERARRLEITLPDGVRLKVEGSFDGDELARLVKGLIT